jgi:hypothetical protein
VTARFRIVGSDLPGSTCGPSSDQPGGYSHIHLGIQRGREVIDLVAADEAKAVFEFDVDIRNGRLAGPFIHGRQGQRFVYLSWGQLIDDDFRMFRRAKLHVDHLDPAQVDGQVVEGKVTLTDGRGHPLCASVRPPRIVWTIR